MCRDTCIPVDHASCCDFTCCHFCCYSLDMDICLMGLPKVGKTSIAKVIFQKMNPKLTLMLEETSKVESFEFKLHNIPLRVFDFPGKYDISEAPPNELMIIEGCYAVIFVINAQVLRSTRCSLSPSPIRLRCSMTSPRTFRTIMRSAASTCSSTRLRAMCLMRRPGRTCW